MSQGVWSFVLCLDRPGLSSLTDFLSIPWPLCTLPPCTLCWDTRTALHWSNEGKTVKILGYINREATVKLLALVFSACHLLYADEMPSP